MRYAEIEIGGWMTFTPADSLALGYVLRGRADIEAKGYSLVHGEEIAARFDALRAEGVRAAILTIDSCGGQGGAAVRIIEAMQRFRAAGGTTIAYVPRVAASTACDVMVSADFVIIGPAAIVLVHSSAAAPSLARVHIAQANGRMLATYATRTATPKCDLQEWVTLEPRADGFPVMELAMPAALAWGWADWAGDESTAAQVAEVVARGLAPQTRRQEMLRARASGAEVVGPLHPELAAYPPRRMFYPQYGTPYPL